MQKMQKPQLQFPLYSEDKNILEKSKGSINKLGKHIGNLSDSIDNTIKKK